MAIIRSGINAASTALEDMLTVVCISTARWRGWALTANEDGDSRFTAACRYLIKLRYSFAAADTCRTFSLHQGIGSRRVEDKAAVRGHRMQGLVHWRVQKSVT